MDPNLKGRKQSAARSPRGIPSPRLLLVTLALTALGGTSLAIFSLYISARLALGRDPLNADTAFGLIFSVGIAAHSILTVIQHLSAKPRRLRTTAVINIYGLIFFLGVTGGLVAVPIRSLLAGAGINAADVGYVLGYVGLLLALAWAIFGGKR